MDSWTRVGLCDALGRRWSCLLPHLEETARQAGEASAPRSFSAPSHFPFGPKRFMVRTRFALGEIEFMINIKGLASGLRLWRVV